VLVSRAPIPAPFVHEPGAIDEEGRALLSPAFPYVLYL
jgi:hypothetical protein